MPVYIARSTACSQVTARHSMYFTNIFPPHVPDAHCQQLLPKRRECRVTTGQMMPGCRDCRRVVYVADIDSVYLLADPCKQLFFFIYINISVRGQCGFRTVHGWVTMWSRTRAADDNLTNGHRVFPAFNCGPCSLKQKPFHV